MRREYRKFRTAAEMAESFAEELVGEIRKSRKRNSPFNIALSGGNTPQILFSILAEKHNDPANWENVNFFWVDERCVPPGDNESNYGMAARLFFSRTDIKMNNIHRIKGEEVPDKEAERYGKEIIEHTKMKNKFPVFNLIILGMGDDGHTASIFPRRLDLLKSTEVCEMASHPVTGQKRITLTGKVINNAESVVFMVTGKNKSAVIRDIFGNGVAAVNFPASYIIPEHGKLLWLLDQEAGSSLE